MHGTPKAQGDIQRTRDPEGTRKRLLQCAFEEMYERGYAGASLDQILADSGVTKGALYHHFGSKRELALAVMYEVIHPLILERWVGPVRSQDDPITALVGSALGAAENLTDYEIACGCPINNLTQELANVDESFRERLSHTYDLWRSGLSEALNHGQRLGTVRTDVDSKSIAAFVVASFEGFATTMKSSRDRELGAAVAKTLAQFLESLRPAASGASVT